MNIMELGAIGELVGGVAVIASLIFVGIQLRRSTNEEKLSSIRTATRETGGAVQWFQDPERAEVWLQGMRDFESLAAVDKLRFSAILVHWFRVFEQIYYQSHSNSVEMESWHGFDRQLQDWAANPGFGHWWELRKYWFGGGFQAHVELYLNRPGAIGSYASFEQDRGV